MSLDPSNSVLAVGALDGYISFWDLRIGHHLFTINAFSPILTLEFKPVESASRELILMSTCSDGYAKFWTINIQLRTFSATPVKFHCKSLAKDEIRCASFSPSGLRFITGATDGIVRLFAVPDAADIRAGIQPSITLPYVQYLEDHEGYVNSIYFSSRGTEFLTSSSDGTVRQWKYHEKSWRSEVFNTSRGGGTIGTGRPRKVTIVTYCNNDESIVAAVNQGFELVLFDTNQDRPAIPLHFHRGEVYILTTSPADDRIVLSAGCDGQVALWNMQTGQRIFEFHLENTRFLDGGFSSNGNMFVLVDDLGRFSVFGCGISPDTFALAPPSQFFPTDWNELIYDAQRNTIDAVTQRTPHYAPRDCIVSIERAPYEPILKEDYPLSMPIDPEEPFVLRQRQQYMKQLEAETTLFKEELASTIPGSTPRHTRTRRRRLLYGSDVEEEPASAPAEVGPPTVLESDDETFQLPSGGTETDADVLIASTDQEPTSPGPYNFRRRLVPHGPSPVRLSRRSGRLQDIPELPDDDEEPLYRPDHRHRSTPRRRRRPIIAESSGDEVSSGHVMQPSKWLTARDRQPFPYLPQLYDVIAYFPEGHQMFLKREKGAQFHDSLPWDVEGHLPAVVFGQIISLNFFPGEPTWCLIEVLLLSRTEAREDLPPPPHIPANSRRIQISFYDMENQPDFIIPYCRYHWSVQSVQRYKVGEIVRVVFSREEAYEGRIKKLKVPSDRVPDRPWQCYLVEWLSLPDAPEFLSPWELETILEEDAPDRQTYSCDEFIDPDVLRQIDEGIKKLLVDPRAAPFKRAVDLRNFPDYLEDVAYPMDLTLLHYRVLSGYHRRIEAFEWDARLIYENAYAYNLPESDIVTDAEYILSELVRLVKRAERGTRRMVSRRVEEERPQIQNVSPRRMSRRVEEERSQIQNVSPRRNRAASEREARARRRAGLDLQIHTPSAEATPSTPTPRSPRSSSARAKRKRRRIRYEEETSSGNESDTEEEDHFPSISQSRRLRTAPPPPRRSSPDHFGSTLTRMNGLRRSSRFIT